MAEPDVGSFSCPVPAPSGERIQLAHGGGGRAMARLLERLFLPAFSNPVLDRRHDGAALQLDGRTAFTTDGFVVRPLFFPGGDIGSLAINGTVNDLAMCGARPLYLSAGFILEDGLEMAILERVVASMRAAADTAKVQLVAGDTKVVERGKADGLFITTAGIGRIEAPNLIAPSSIQPGDAVLVSGDLGRHGMAVMAARHELGLESDILSDCAPLSGPVLELIEAGIELHCLRDLTRGGLASALVEIAETAGLALHLDETKLPVRDDVRAACELLGLDPVYVANEGRFIAILPAHEVDRALQVLQQSQGSASAVQIGHVEPGHPGRVTMRGQLGANRVLDMLSGEQLPRIC